MALIYGIDPGPERSGFVAINHVSDGESFPQVLEADGEIHNGLVRTRIREADPSVTVCCEVMSAIRATVDQNTFETCYAIGEFRNETKSRHMGIWIPIEARSVKRGIIGTVTGSSSLVMRELVKMFAFGETDPAKAKRAAVGTVKHPGPLFGVSKHAWMALACVMVYLKSRREVTHVVASGDREAQVSTQTVQGGFWPARPGEGES